MTVATLNGVPALGLEDGAVVVAEADEGMRKVRLRLLRNDEELWSTEELDLGPEPTRGHSTSQSADYLAVSWPEVGGLVLLGDSAAILVSLRSGAVLASFSLEFTGQSALEQVGLELTTDRRFLLATSTKRLWVIGSDLRPVVRYDPRFILAGLPRFHDGQIIVEEYDFDSDQEIVTQTLEL